MSFLSKISLLALLASGIALGMEQPPHLKVPATNTTIQASDGRIINITLNNHLLEFINSNIGRISTAAAITTALGFGLYKWTQHK